MKNNHVWFGAGVGNEYPGNWGDIIDMYRISQDYRCEQCGVDLSGLPNLAIIHHVNGSHPEVGGEYAGVMQSRIIMKESLISINTNITCSENYHVLFLQEY